MTQTSRFGAKNNQMGDMLAHTHSHNFKKATSTPQEMKLMSETEYRNGLFSDQGEMKLLMKDLLSGIYDHEDRFGDKVNRTRVLMRKNKPVDMSYLQH